MPLYVLRFRFSALALLVLCTAGLPRARAADKNATPDTLVLKDGNTLHGKLVSEAGGTVTFSTPALGDVNVPWANIQELHATEDFAVLPAHMKSLRKKTAARLPVGPLDATSESVTVHRKGQEAVPQPIPSRDAAFIVSQDTLNRQLYHTPGFFQGWNGAVTAGSTLVTATQNQYTFSGSVGLTRAVPTVSWLDTRNRTSADFTGSFGKITQPAYSSPTGPVAATLTKTSILHFGAERDEYFSPRMFGLAQTSFDHNFSQDLSLQQIYGGGVGWTAVKTAKQQADFKATVQYEKQNFISGSSSANQNLIGSTLSADYMRKQKIFTLTQEIAYIPAFNNLHAYSAEETDTVALPAWKNFAFSLGTIDSYLNDPPITYPTTKLNSFQFTMGLTYAIKSRY
jgi:hypothetical protein